MHDIIEKYKKHISALWEVNCNLLDARLKTFGEQEMFCKKCPIGCDFVNTHLYGCYESVRWNNKYIYYCPGGFTFVAVPIREDEDIVNKAVITGPILMGDIEDIENSYGLPYFETAKVNDLAEVVSAVFAPRLKCNSVISTSEEFLNTIYKELESYENYKSYPISLESELKSAVLEGDGLRAKEIINKLLGQVFFYSNNDFAIIKTRVLELIILLSRSAIEGGADVEQIFALNNTCVREIEKYTTLDRLNIWLIEVINRFVSYVFEFNDVKHADIIYKIISYIKSNYMKRITLEDIAEHVYFSKTYISRIFKEEMNVTLSKYINKTRIEKSKILLLDCSLSLTDVATLVGFEEQSYYTKIFRGFTGMSPGKYREKHGINKNI